MTRAQEESTRCSRKVLSLSENESRRDGCHGQTDFGARSALHQCGRDCDRPLKVARRWRRKVLCNERTVLLARSTASEHVPVDRTPDNCNQRMRLIASSHDSVSGIQRSGEAARTKICRSHQNQPSCVLSASGDSFDRILEATTICSG